MGRTLTPLQQAFLNGLIEGKTRYQAYIDAGYSTKGKSRKYIDTKAWELYAKTSDGEIKRRFEEHQKAQQEELEKKQLWTKEDSIRTLTWLIGKSTSEIDKKGVRAANQQAVVSSIKELNAILGINFDSQLKADMLRKDDSIESDAVIVIKGSDELED